MRSARTSCSSPAIIGWRLLLLFAVVISSIALMLTSAVSIQIDSGWDKLNHVVGFAAMGFAGCMGWPASRRACLLVLLGLLAFDRLIELLRLAIREFDAEWGGLIADAVGMAWRASPAIFLLSRGAQARTGCW